MSNFCRYILFQDGNGRQLSRFAPFQEKTRGQSRGEILLFIQLSKLSLQIHLFLKSNEKATFSEIVTVANANQNTIKMGLVAFFDTKHLQKMVSGIGLGMAHSNSIIVLLLDILKPK